MVSTVEAAAFIKQLPGLMAALQNAKADEKDSIAALRKLRVQFVELLHTDMLKYQQDVKNNTAGKVVAHLMDRYYHFESFLLLALKRKTSLRFQMEAWQTIMECVRAESVGHFNHHLFCQAAWAFLTSKRTSVNAVEQFVKHFAESWDVRLFWLQQVEKVARATTDVGLREAWQDPSPVTVLYTALSLVEASLSETPQSWCGGVEAGVLATAPIKREGTKARRKRKRTESELSAAGSTPATDRAVWASREAQVSAYRVSIPEGLFKVLLPMVTTTVITSIKNPVTLSDFLTKATDQGGLVGILALQGLFILVTQHGLEHPDFYKRLYALLTPQVFTARYRVKFLQLVDIFLASSMVPAYSAAAFAKKFARLSVTAPPVGALACLAFVHNLIRRHPSCICLIHRQSKGVAGESLDPYNPEAEDLDDSKGIESNLWELSVAKVHLDPTVAAFAQRFETDVTNRKKVAEIDMQTILMARYKTQLHEALDKKIHTAPAVCRSDISPTDALQVVELPGCSI